MNESLGVQDTSVLTDADWAEINRLRKVLADQGPEALNKAFAELQRRDVILHARVAEAFFPNEFKEAFRDEMAAAGMDEDDLRELVRKLESPARDQ